MKRINWIIFLALIIASCTKKPTNYPVENKLRAAFSYQPGTYWVYKDSVSGALDSFVLINQHLLNGLIDNSGNTYEEIDVTILQKHKNPHLEDSSFWYLKIQKNIISAGRIWYLPQTTTANFGPMPYPFVVAKLNDSLNKIKKIIPSLTMNYNVFDTVAVCNSDTVNKTYSKIYFNTADGIIKIDGRSYRDTTHVVLELLRWHLIKS